MNNITIKPVHGWKTGNHTTDGVLIRGAAGGFVIVDHAQINDVIARLTALQSKDQPTLRQ